MYFEAGGERGSQPGVDAEWFVRRTPNRNPSRARAKCGCGSLLV